MDWKLNGTNLSQLSPNEITELEFYADGTDVVSARAKGVLWFNNSLDYYPPIVLPQANQNKNMVYAPSSGNPTTQGLLEVTPNPSINFFTLHYRIDQPYNEAVAQLIDNKGVLVKSIPLTYEEDEIVVGTQTLVKGNYQLILLIDGKAYLNNTIVVL